MILLIEGIVIGALATLLGVAIHLALYGRRRLKFYEDLGREMFRKNMDEFIESHGNSPCPVANSVREIFPDLCSRCRGYFAKTLRDLPEKQT